MAQRRSVIKVKKEPVILTKKSILVKRLSGFIRDDEDRILFQALCGRIEALIVNENRDTFEELKELQNLFDPLKADQKPPLPPGKSTEECESRFLEMFHDIMKKSNFKMLSKDEWKVATSSKYLLQLDIELNEHRLDDKLFRKLPENTKTGEEQFLHRCLIYRRGIGCDKVQGYFMLSKLDEIQRGFWRMIRACFCFGNNKQSPEARLFYEDKPAADADVYTSEEDMERIHICDIKIKNLFQKVELQEPTFSQIIVMYRTIDDRSGIHIKQFNDIPMADMELVFPEKKTPKLNWTEWIKLIVSAVTGVAGFWEAFKKGHSSHVWLAFTILATFVAYCFKVYLTFHINVLEYHRLISKSIYDKQIDSHSGTLLHLCENVIDQEVVETVVGYYVLMVLGKAGVEELRYTANVLLEREFKEKCDFEVDDAIRKLQMFHLVNKTDDDDTYECVPLKLANERLQEQLKERA